MGDFVAVNRGGSRGERESVRVKLQAFLTSCAKLLILSNCIANTKAIEYVPFNNVNRMISLLRAGMPLSSWAVFTESRTA